MINYLTNKEINILGSLARERGHFNWFDLKMEPGEGLLFGNIWYKIASITCLICDINIDYSDQDPGELFNHGRYYSQCS